MPSPNPPARTIPMEVLSLGMPRTGTASIQAALNILSLPCYHGTTLISNLQKEAEMWVEALDAKYFGKGEVFTRERWDRLLGGYAAVCDVPAIAFVEELIGCYPDAKVILVEEGDIDAWYRRFDEEEIGNIWRPTFRVLARLDTQFIGKLGAISSRWVEGWFKAHSRAEMQARARAMYREHCALVGRIVPAESLLRYRLEEGWLPLCAFLGRPVPDVAFPCIDEGTKLREEILGIVCQGGRNTLVAGGKVAVLVGVVVVAWAWLRVGVGNGDGDD